MGDNQFPIQSDHTHSPTDQFANNLLLIYELQIYKIAYMLQSIEDSLLWRLRLICDAFSLQLQNSTQMVSYWLYSGYIPM